MCLCQEQESCGCSSVCRGVGGGEVHVGVVAVKKTCFWSILFCKKLSGAILCQQIQQSYRYDKMFLFYLCYSDWLCSIPEWNASSSLQSSSKHKNTESALNTSCPRSAPTHCTSRDESDVWENVWDIACRVNITKPLFLGCRSMTFNVTQITFLQCCNNVCYNNNNRFWFSILMFCSKAPSLWWQCFIFFLI